MNLLLLLLVNAHADPTDPAALTEALARCAERDVHGCERAGTGFAGLVVRDREHDVSVWVQAHYEVVRAMCEAGDAEACSVTYQFQRACELDPRRCMRPSYDVPVSPPLSERLIRSFAVTQDGTVIPWEHGRLFFDTPLVEGANRASPSGEGWVFFRDDWTMPRFAVVRPEGTEVVELELKGQGLCELFAIGDTHALVRLRADDSGACALHGVVDLHTGVIEPLPTRQSSLSGSWLAVRTSGGDIEVRQLTTGESRQIPWPDGAEGGPHVSAGGDVAVAGEGRAWVWSGQSWVDLEASSIRWTAGGELLAVERSDRLPEHGASAMLHDQLDHDEWVVVYAVEGGLRPVRARPSLGDVEWLVSEQAYVGRWTGQAYIMQVPEVWSREAPAWLDRERHAASLVRELAPTSRTWTVRDQAGAPMAGVRIGDHRSDAEGLIGGERGGPGGECAWVDDQCRVMRADRRQGVVTVGPAPMVLALPDGAEALLQLDERGLQLADATRLADGRVQVRWFDGVHAFVARTDAGWYVAAPGGDGLLHALPSSQFWLTDTDGRPLPGLEVAVEVPKLGTFSAPTDLQGRIVLPTQHTNPRLAVPRGFFQPPREMLPFQREGDHLVWAPDDVGETIPYSDTQLTSQALVGRWTVNGSPRLLTDGMLRGPLVAGRVLDPLTSAFAPDESHLLIGSRLYTNPSPLPVAEKTTPSRLYARLAWAQGDVAWLVPEGRSMPQEPETTRVEVIVQADGFTGVRPSGPDHSEDLAWSIHGMPTDGDLWWMTGLAYLQLVSLPRGELHEETFSTAFTDAYLSARYDGLVACPGGKSRDCADVTTTHRSSREEWTCQWVVEPDTLRPHRVACRVDDGPLHITHFVWNPTPAPTRPAPGRYDTVVNGPAEPDSCGPLSALYEPASPTVVWDGPSTLVIAGFHRCQVEGDQISDCTKHTGVDPQVGGGEAAWRVGLEGQVVGDHFELRATYEVSCVSGSCSSYAKRGIKLPCSFTQSTKMVPAAQ